MHVEAWAGVAMNLTTRLRPHESVVSRCIAGETILVSLKRSVADLRNLITLNETGAFVWARLDGDATLEAVRDAVVAEFAVTPDDAWRDLLSFAERLRDVGAVIEA
jgi:hypothetical protein